jgi:hypothetical protein
MSETTLWGASLPPVEEPKPAPEHSVNPCIDMYGPGPEGRICRDCVHLQGFKQSATWYKCTKRAWKTKGGKYPGTVYPGPDHRVRYPACAKFEEREEKQDD